jgi:hypothetical protein
VDGFCKHGNETSDCIAKFCVAERRAAFREGLISMELVS